MKVRDWQLTRQENKLERARAWELRRCLKCELWMRSTGPDHRICNTCRNSHYCDYSKFRREGQRVHPASRCRGGGEGE